MHGVQLGVWDKESHIAGGERVPDWKGSGYHTAGGCPIALPPAAWQSQFSQAIRGACAAQIILWNDVSQGTSTTLGKIRSHFEDVGRIRKKEEKKYDLNLLIVH